jgi:hypothetical protein
LQFWFDCVSVLVVGQPDLRLCGGLRRREFGRLFDSHLKDLYAARLDGGRQLQGLGTAIAGRNGLIFSLDFGV